MSLRTDNPKNYTTDILDILVNEMGAPNPGIIRPKDLDAVIRSIPGGEPNFLRVKMTQIIDGDTCEIHLETEETPNGFLGYIENNGTQEINLIQEI